MPSSASKSRSLQTAAEAAGKPRTAGQANTPVEGPCVRTADPEGLPGGAARGAHLETPAGCSPGGGKVTGAGDKGHLEAPSRGVLSACNQARRCSTSALRGAPWQGPSSESRQLVCADEACDPRLSPALCFRLSFLGSQCNCTALSPEIPGDQRLLCITSDCVSGLPYRPSPAVGWALEGGTEGQGTPKRWKKRRRGDFRTKTHL